MGLALSVVFLWGSFRKKQADMELGDSLREYAEPPPYPERPPDPIPGSLENGKWVFCIIERKSTMLVKVLISGEQAVALA